MIPSGLLKNVREASTLAETQFRNGSIGAQLYLDTQSAYLDALRASQNAVLDAWRTLLDLNLLPAEAMKPREKSREGASFLTARRVSPSVFALAGRNKRNIPSRRP